MADSQSPLGACAVERDFKVGPQANAKATVLHRERMGECPSSNANRTRSQRHGSPLGACAVERDFKVGPQANAKATVLHRERMGECPSSNANRTRSQRHGSPHAPEEISGPRLSVGGFIQRGGKVEAKEVVLHGR